MYVAPRTARAAAKSADKACCGVVEVRPMVASLRDPLAGIRVVDLPRIVAGPNVRPAAAFSASNNHICGSAPLRGEHNAQVPERVIGYGPQELQKLEADEVILADPDLSS